MMYIHYCRHCKRIHMLNGHKKYCPACRGHLNELKISYLKYVNLAPADLPSATVWVIRRSLPPALQMCAAPTIMQNGCS